jgi:hypothetical protein
MSPYAPYGCFLVKEKRLGEVIYRVPSLSLPGPEDSGFAPGSSDAVALFAERARAHGVALTVDGQARPEMVSVCRLLNGGQPHRAGAAEDQAVILSECTGSEPHPFAAPSSIRKLWAQ